MLPSIVKLYVLVRVFLPVMFGQLKEYLEKICEKLAALPSSKTASIFCLDLY